MKKSTVESNKDELIENFKAVIADAEALLKETSGQSGEKIAEIRAKAEQSLKAVKEAMSDAQEALIVRTKAVAQATDVYVHEKPWEAIGMVAGLGFLVGWLVSRR